MWCCCIQPHIQEECINIASQQPQTSPFGAVAYSHVNSEKLEQTTSHNSKLCIRYRCIQPHNQSKTAAHIMACHPICAPSSAQRLHCDRKQQLSAAACNHISATAWHGSCAPDIAAVVQPSRVSSKQLHDAIRMLVMHLGVFH